MQRTAIAILFLLVSCSQEPTDHQNPCAVAKSPKKPACRRSCHSRAHFSPSSNSAAGRVGGCGSALAKVRKVIVSKPITFSYDILEDGSGSECQILASTGRSEAQRQPSDLARRALPRADEAPLSARRSAKTEINFQDTPLPAQAKPPAVPLAPDLAGRLPRKERRNP